MDTEAGYWRSRYCMNLRDSTGYCFLLRVFNGELSESLFMVYDV